jgi:hypothetical protein
MNGMDRDSRQAKVILAALVGLPVLVIALWLGSTGHPGGTVSPSPVPPVAQASTSAAATGLSSAPVGSPSPTGTASPKGASPSPAPSRAATPAPTPTPTPAISPRPSPSAVATPTPATSTSAIVPGSVGRSSLDLTASYDVVARLGYGTRALAVDTAITVRNDSGSGIDRLELNTIAVRLGRPAGLTATVDGRPVRPTIADQTIIVPLGGVLPNGATTLVRVGFTATLRSGTSGSDWLFTRANGVVDLYRWIPWVSAARPFDRPNDGDPFVTSTATLVRVRMTTDRPLVFATTGERVAVQGLTQTFEARDVRDLVMTAAADYQVTTRKVGSTTIRAYVRPGHSATSELAWAARALARYASLLGPYPYPTLSIAAPAGGYGMEAPALVWIPGTTTSSILPDLVAHEVAHQWFFALVGNDQALQPFADEGPAEFMARTLLGAFPASRCSTTRLDLSVYRYSLACYYQAIYIGGADLLESLRQTMGDTDFWRGMRAYVSAERWRIGGTKPLLDALDAATSLDLRPRLRLRFPSLY